MEQTVQVGVRYCGGCNPRFDRVALVRELARRFPQAAFSPAQPGSRYAAVLAVCGCSAQCVGVSDLALPGQPLLWVRDDGPSLFAARQALEELLPRSGT